MTRFLLFLLIFPTALGGEFALQAFGPGWIARYLGISGTLLIVASLAYALRKHGLISAGRPAPLLRVHEVGAWLGSLMVLIHAGSHCNAILPWLAVTAMAINVISGLVGKYLLGHARGDLEARRATLLQQGRNVLEVEDALFWDSLLVNAMRQWRTVHLPIFAAFAILASGHILSILLFWDWT